MNVKEILLRFPVIKQYKQRQQKKNFKGSVIYWEQRYQGQGNSGSGSYSHLAEFKADTLNKFVISNNIKKVIEFGCGDGNQLLYTNYPEYIGLDVAPTAIKLCLELFKNDSTKSFYLYESLAFRDNAGLFRGDLVISLDVLFHLVEQTIFESYISHLFNSSTRFVIIYASDFDQEKDTIYRHDKRRSFTGFVKNNFAGWELKEIIRNPYPVEEYKEAGSLSDFYIYHKK